MVMAEIILASTSPRRIEMMRGNGITPLIVPPDVMEIIPSGLSMEQVVMYLALKKALSAEEQVLKKFNSDQSVIISADTVVYADRILGKPKDRQEAFAMLTHLRNRSHQVATGVAILSPGGANRLVFYEITEVFFKSYSDLEITEYSMTREPYDKAGGYAIQGSWGRHIDHIVGDRNNVIGFPWDRIKGALQANFGLLIGK
jgi:septum formation protein